MNKPRIYKSNGAWWCEGDGGCRHRTSPKCSGLTPFLAYLEWLALVTGYDRRLGVYPGTPTELRELARRLIPEGRI